VPCFPLLLLLLLQVVRCGVVVVALLLLPQTLMSSNFSYEKAATKPATSKVGCG
jgi:hypothetical protein